MANKANFTQEEWARLLASPVVTGIAITRETPAACGEC